MFKKTLSTLSVLATFSLSATAANVTMYGIVDSGIGYNHYEFAAGKNISAETFDNYDLGSGFNHASRFGLKGSEELPNGLTVSFVLENGFESDDGELSSENKLFDREARLTISSDWGELSAGRIGAIGSSYGSYDTIYAVGDAFDGGDNDLFTGVLTDRYDNMVTYRTPKIVGLQATVQYSFKLSNAKAAEDDAVSHIWGSGEEGHSSANRYFGFALTGNYGALETVVAYEQIVLGTEVGEILLSDDTVIATIGANYDLGMAKLFGMGQYYENAPLKALSISTPETNGFMDGQAYHLGIQLPIMSGTLTGGLYYSEADDSFSHMTTYKTFAGSIKYEYPLSARTSFYSSIGYGQLKNDWHFDHSKLKLTQAYVGVTHAF